MNWNNITVRQYQQIHPILMSEDTDEEKLYQITLILEGKGITAAEYESKIEQYGFLAQIEVQPKKVDRFSVNGRHYRMNYDIGKMPAARYIEIKTFMGNGDFIENLDRILASAVIPQKKTLLGYKDMPYIAEHHSSYANDMQDANFLELYSSLVFFYLRLPLLISSSPHYTQKRLMMKMKKAEQQAMQILLESTMDGFSAQSKWQTLSALR